MIRRIVSSECAALAAALLIASPASAAPDGAALYAAHCAACHAETRLGGTGPALIPQTLGRIGGPELEAVIAHGRAASQMPGFAEVLSLDEIAAIAAHLKQPLTETPHWGVAEMLETRSFDEAHAPATTPVFTADPMNVTLAVEIADSQISVLDGDTFAVLARFETPFAVHGGPKFSPDGRLVYVVSRDGWVQKYDLWGLTEMGRIRAGLNARNIAISADGKWLAVANYLPMTLTILDAETLMPEKVIEIRGRDGTPSRVSAVYQAPPRDSFVLALKDIPEVWEISTSDNPPHTGWVHDTRVEGPPEIARRFPVRKMGVEQILDDFFFDQNYEHVIGASRATEQALVIDLDYGHKVAEIDLPGMPHLGSGITWAWGGTRIMATPHLKEGMISFIDMATWQTVKRIRTEGPGFFMRSHENSRYVWADVFFGPNKDAMHVIDKETLEIVRTLRPAPGQTVAHTEFTRDGRHALVSIWEDDGAVIVYDAETLTEVTRLPMRKPSGKYNVWNKITFAEGTSH
ncbi:cytochrome D1 domain-containing protein [Roseovarius autotrophicus]|uniref:cytochrome D1 domain-containing protein n=1 Tax=Roseovarius autotrophicus TaxID=2824121 RepID=UPI001A08D357|nr:nitrite reductase [Roseovarius autotrophicus]MBE0452731.1 c-type cytochrome [Roseovarius sp.]